MDEYISKEIAIERIKRVKPHVVMSEYGVGYERGLKDAIGILNATPAADVQPVKHGKWETWGYVFHGIEWERCSVCGKTADISYIALLEGRIEPVTPSFCGCCGARMDSDDDETL